MSRSPRSLQRYAPPLLILLVATLARFYLLDGQSFWNDEGNSARLSERSIRLIIEGTASDIHPPLYYLLLRGWRELVGSTEFGLRAMSAFAGVLLVALVLPLSRIFRLPRLVGLSAMTLTALSVPLIYYSQELRMYMLLPLLAVGSTVALGRLLDQLSSEESNQWSVISKQWRSTDYFSLLTVYCLLLTAGLYTHYFFPIILPLHGLMVLLWAGWRRVVGWLGLVAVAVLLYAPWLPIALRPLGGNRGVPQAWTSFFGRTSNFFLYGRAFIVDRWPLALALLLLLGLFPLLRRQRAGLLPAFVAVPMAALITLNATDDEFAKFLLLSVPFLWLLILNLATQAASKRLMAATCLLLTFTVAIFSLDALHETQTNPTLARDDYRGMANTITAESANPAVILNGANQWEVFTYYFDRVDAVYPLPQGAPDVAAISAELTTAAANHDRLYALYWGDQQRDPDRLVEGWLESNSFKISEEWVGDVRFVRYAPPSDLPDTLQTPLNVTFGEQIVLEGVTLGTTRRQPLDLIELTLYWQATQPIAQRYKVFVQLIGPNGLPLAQQDREPVSGLAPTDSWTVGDSVADKYALIVPADAPSGLYRLHVGLYSLVDASDRLPIDSPNAIDNAYPLTDIIIGE